MKIEASNLPKPTLFGNKLWEDVQNTFEFIKNVFILFKKIFML